MQANFTISLEAKSSYEELINIREFIQLHSLQAGLSEAIAFNLALAVDEVCTNIIKYSYKEDFNNTIKLELINSADKLEIDIFDNGPSFNPLVVPEVDKNDYFKSYKKGGLGVVIIKSLVDTINYFPNLGNDNYNKLVLEKYKN